MCTLGLCLDLESRYQEAKRVCVRSCPLYCITSNTCCVMCIQENNQCDEAKQLEADYFAMRANPVADY